MNHHCDYSGLQFVFSLSDYRACCVPLFFRQRNPLLPSLLSFSALRCILSRTSFFDLEHQFYCYFHSNFYQRRILKFNRQKRTSHPYFLVICYHIYSLDCSSHLNCSYHWMYDDQQAGHSEKSRIYSFALSLYKTGCLQDLIIDKVGSNLFNFRSSHPAKNRQENQLP